MKISVKAKPTFVADVSFPAPGGETVAIKVTFRHKTRDEFDAFMESMRDGAAEPLEAMLTVIDGWEGVEEVFSRESFVDLTQNYHRALRAFIEAYGTELVAARVGN